MVKKKRSRPDRHKQSLAEQLENPETYGVRTKPRPEKRRRSAAADVADSDAEEDEGGFVPRALTGRILDVAREQQEEVDAVENDAGPLGSSAREALAAAMQNLTGEGLDSDDDDRELGGGNDGLSDPGSDWDGEDWEQELGAEDEAAFAAFMAPDAAEHRQKTLSDVIMERIREKQAETGVSQHAR